MELAEEVSEEELESSFGDEDAQSAEVEGEKEEQASADPEMPAWKAKLFEQLPFLAKLLPSGGSPVVGKGKDSAQSTEQEKKKKIIRLVIAIILAFIVIDTFMPSEEVPTVEDLPAETPKPKKKRKKENPTAPAAPSEQAAATPTPVEGAAGPVETQPTQSEASTSAPAVDVAPEPKPEELVADVPAEDSVFTAPEEGSASDLSPGVETQDVSEEPSTQDVFADLGGGEAGAEDVITDNATQTDMTEQVLQDLEKQIQANKEQDARTSPTSYVEPPTYEYVGRGLVYNCKGKHWACIDGPSYKICEQNYAALKSQSKSKECYPDSVYQSDSGCAWVQKKKILANTKTDFCN